MGWGLHCRSAKNGLPVDGYLRTMMNENASPIAHAPMRPHQRVSYSQVYGTMSKQPSRNHRMMLAPSTNRPLVRYLVTSPVTSLVT